MLHLFPFGSVITAQYTILMIPRYIYLKRVIPVRVTESGKGAPLLSDRCIRSTFKIPFLIVLIIRVVFRDCEAPANLLLQARTAHTGSSISL